jgi:hypothetical protein
MSLVRTNADGTQTYVHFNGESHSLFCLNDAIASVKNAEPRPLRPIREKVSIRLVGRMRMAAYRS